MREPTVATQLTSAIMPPESPATPPPLLSLLLLLNPPPEFELVAGLEGVGPELYPGVDEAPPCGIEGDEAAGACPPFKNLLSE